MIEELKTIIQAQEDSCASVPVDGWNGDETQEEMDNFDGDMVHEFPNGDHSAICTSWADDLRERFSEKRVALFGYDGSLNPDTAVSRIADGHDFAILDGRYIVDGWVKFVETNLEARGVYDIDDDGDLPEIVRLYGDPSTWEPRDNIVADPDGVVAERFCSRIEAFQANAASLGP